MCMEISMSVDKSISMSVDKSIQPFRRTCFRNKDFVNVLNTFLKWEHLNNFWWKGAQGSDFVLLHFSRTVLSSKLNPNPLHFHGRNNLCFSPLLVQHLELLSQLATFPYTAPFSWTCWLGIMELTFNNIIEGHQPRKSAEFNSTGIIYDGNNFSIFLQLSANRCLVY